MKGTIADWERERFADRAAREIAALPETAEPTDVSTVATSPEGEPIVLCERGVCGEAVTLRWLGDDRVAITVEVGGSLQGAVVPPEKALDAFYHPYVYLP